MKRTWLKINIPFKYEVTVKIIRVFILILLLNVCSIWTFGCAGSRHGQITLLHTNDMHAQYVPMPATWVQKDPKPMIGGMVALEFQIRKARETYPATLLFDAGDFMTGTPIAKMEIDGALGGGFVRMMNLLGYNAFTIGNHEFDEGQENLNRLISLMRFDVLSANLFKDGRLMVKKPYAIYRSGGLRIGVIGVTLTDLFEMTAKKNLTGIRVDDPAPIVQKIIDKIDGKTDLIVLLTHQGVDADLDLAQRIHGADIIIGGHSHTRLNEAIVKNNILIVQADNKTRYLGRLTVDVDKDKVTHYDYRLIPTWADSVRQPNAALAAMVDSLKQQIDLEYGRVVGQLLDDWRRSGQGESNLGDYIADAIRGATGTDFAVLNSGGIRKDLGRGPVKKMDIVEILPFSNTVVLFNCTGEELMTMIRTNARASVRNEPGILQISGLRYSYRLRPDGTIEIPSATIGGEPIDPKKNYRGATVDFVLFGQAERYFGFQPQQGVENTNLMVSGMVIDQIEKNPEIQSVLDLRIQQLP